MLDDAIAFVFDGAGGAVAIAPDAPRGDLDGPPFEWRHYRRDAPETPRRLAAAGLDPFVIAALTADETRPRCTRHGTGAVMTLRGVNRNPGAQPEDMVSVRLWLEKDRVIGVWIRPLLAVDALVEAIGHGRAVVSVGDFVAQVATLLADRAEPYVSTLSDRIDEIEEAMVSPQPTFETSRSALLALRRSAIVVRRHFVPQRDALVTFETEDLGWLSDRDRMRLREAVERTIRLGEELDTIRDRAQLAQEQIMDERAERLNAQSLLLSVVAAIFLPLGLLTGLLGINVGGIPGASSPWGFAIVSLLVVVIGLGLFLWVRLSGLFR